ncbi:hypothetical protein [Streptomyces iranensis]|uniref:hypothetical protein n=1 Tax=Streptomyces iranensis TaxID=576784 RepID=UPI0039B7260E
MTSISRRGILTAGFGLAGGIGLATGYSGTAQAAETGHTPATSEWTRKTSANGWPVTRHDDITLHRVEGSPLTVALRDGETATVLTYIARRFFYEIDSHLRPDEVHGHTSDRRVATAFESNYLSGTALTIRPDAYPLGARNGLFPQEVMVVRDILAECGGVIRWGGDESVPKESHFQIDVAPGDRRLKALAGRIDAWRRTPGQGPGAIDTSLPERRRAARAMARIQAGH